MRLATSGSFQALVQLTATDPSVHTGQTVTVVTEGAGAQLQPSAVLLTNCDLVGVLDCRRPAPFEFSLIL